MAKDEKFPKWQGKYAIVDADHVHNLETMAAINEFSHKMPRHEAEEHAHKQYMREQLVAAAAHHLAGIKAAQGAGDTESIKRHGVMYQLAMRGLGHDPIGEPPAEVTEHMQHQPLKVYKFKAHPADAFAMPMWQHEIVGTKVEKSEGGKNMSRHKATGRYSYQGNWDRVCKCGRRLGEHDAEPPHACNKVDDKPECDGFKLVMKKAEPDRHLHDRQGAQVYDYSDHLSEQDKANGYVLHVHHWPEGDGQSAGATAVLYHGLGIQPAVTAYVSLAKPDSYMLTHAEPGEHPMHAVSNALSRHVFSTQQGTLGKKG